MRTTAPVDMVRRGYIYVRLPGSPLIEINQSVQGGVPVIRGTRIPASTIAGYYNGENTDYICKGWGLTEAQVKACLEYVNAPWPAAPREGVR